ncbi:MAG: hypothetical protein CL666_01655 [Balneola sp.]|nr:hypothetical protein [Balneola sp.]|tara:strand:+ start:57278 stop:57919 length:642 start_codon:yes stop_codon:yes gene_type:complete
MNKAAILKITGAILVTFIVMVVAIFFLYPKINEEEYTQMVSEFEAQQEQVLQSESQQYSVSEVDPSAYQTAGFAGSDLGLDSASISSGNTTLPDSLMVIDREQYQLKLKEMENNEIRLHSLIDSLYAEIDQLDQQLTGMAEASSEKEELDPAEFTERVKSLLNLEEDELSPILQQMTNEQVVRLYFGGGTIQRQKILRSLEPKRAAELMTEIM